MAGRQQTAPPQQRRSKDSTVHPHQPGDRPESPHPDPAHSRRHHPAKAEVKFPLRNRIFQHAVRGDSEQGVFVQKTPNIWTSPRPMAAAPWTRVRLDETVAGSSPMGTDVTEVWTRVCRDQALSLCFNELTVQATNLVRKFRLSPLVFVRANFMRDTMQHQFCKVREWMEWLFFSGAEHIFLYDHCQFPEECLKD
jgi:hypothetical protein